MVDAHPALRRLRTYVCLGSSNNTPSFLFLPPMLLHHLPPSWPVRSVTLAHDDTDHFFLALEELARRHAIIRLFSLPSPRVHEPRGRKLYYSSIVCGSRSLSVHTVISQAKARDIVPVKGRQISKTEKKTPKVCVTVLYCRDIVRRSL